MLFRGLGVSSWSSRLWMRLLLLLEMPVGCIKAIMCRLTQRFTPNPMIVIICISFMIRIGRICRWVP